MEIVAMDMKLRGMYIARQLSFTGVTFKIEEVPLTLDYIKMYNKSVRLVRKMLNVETIKRMVFLPLHVNAFIKSFILLSCSG